MPLRRALLVAALLVHGGCPGDAEPGAESSSSTATTTAAETSSSTGTSTTDPTTGGFIDTSSESAGSSSTGPACTDEDMCTSLGDCELGDCIDCTCVFDYGPCADGKCTCFVPSVPVCTTGGCFCALPCNVDQPTPCPVAPSGTVAPVCGMERLAGSCGLPCAGEGAPGCPDGMTCVARPDEHTAWGDFICVFP